MMASVFEIEVATALAISIHSSQKETDVSFVGGAIYLCVIIDSILATM